ncbi:MAG: hypothetical protein P4L67_02680 [Candidatus Pacebacteria bacterium]|nr:hypothetical protein [Candidatus Paceibacterota bacterium]
MIMGCAELKNGRSGQAMLIAVLSLGGAILGATAVAGLLTLYQLRAANDSQNSAKAIFAADAGVEWTLFDYYCGLATPARCSGEVALPGNPAGTLSASGATVASTCSDVNGSPSTCSDVNSAVSAITVGTSVSSKRAFAVSLTGATTTDP